MPIAYTIQDPFCWDSQTNTGLNAMNGARRNSLLLSLSNFDFCAPPQRPEFEDMDPFAPLSITDGFALTKPHHHQQQQQQTQHHHQLARGGQYNRVLSDRSESSGGSMPSLHSSSSSSSAAPGLSRHVDLNDSFQLFSQDSGLGHREAFEDVPYEAFSSVPEAAPLSSSSFTTASDDSVDNNLGGDMVADGDDGDSQRFKRFHEEKWSHRYKELLAFHGDFGHSAVPHTFPQNPQLARWVKRQRRQYKLRRDGRPSTMTLDRLQLLDAVGFIWDSHDVNWREKLATLDKFRRLHGHCNVPSNYMDKKLATWVKCQRRQYKLHVDQKPSAMTDQRISELETRGFEWEIRSTSAKAKAGAQPPPPSHNFHPFVV